MENGNLLKPSYHKPCSYFEQGVCRSCTLMGSTVDSGRAQKWLPKAREIVEIFPKVEVLEFFGLDRFVGSRQKAKLAVFRDEHARLQLGIYNLKEKVSLENCPLYSNALQNIIKVTKELLIEAKVLPYHIESKTGEAKFIIITESLPYTDKAHSSFMLRIVLRSKESLDRIKKTAIDFLKKNPEIELMSVNIQPLAAAVLEGDEEILLTENAYFVNGFKDHKLNLTVKSFSQINSYVGFALYEYVKNLIQVNQIKNILDLYCGVGGFSLTARDVVSKAFGVEISKEAISAANLSKNELGLTQYNYEAGDVETIIQYKNFSADGIIVNPPRAGLKPSIIKFINDSSVEYLIYSSCNPETFLRDCTLLKEHYNLISIKPFDMFMMTDHFEVVGFFKKLN